eukprot:1038257-Prymnesium_polylepis.1
MWSPVGRPSPTWQTVVASGRQWSLNVVMDQLSMVTVRLRSINGRYGDAAQYTADTADIARYSRYSRYSRADTAAIQQRYSSDTADTAQIQ